MMSKDNRGKDICSSDIGGSDICGIDVVGSGKEKDCAFAGCRRAEVQETLSIDPCIFEEAHALITNEGTSLVVIDKSKIVYTADGRGIAPLLDLYGRDKEKLLGACVVDRVIGKAAAMILTLGEAGAVYGEVMSKSAADYLRERGIAALSGKNVAAIEGREVGSMCPIESSVLDKDDPAEGLAAITNKLAQLRGIKGES